MIETTRFTLDGAAASARRGWVGCEKAVKLMRRDAWDAALLEEIMPSIASFKSRACAASACSSPASAHWT